MTALAVDLVASLDHYASHLMPIWEALPDDVRGEIRTGSAAGRTPSRNRVCLVASWRDMHPLQGMTKFIYVEHGAGQSYAGDEKSAHWPDYSAGGARHSGVIGYICPSHRVAKMWNHPHAVAVGSPRLDRLLNGWHGPIQRSICFSFHWPCQISPEANTAYWHFHSGLARMVDHCEAQGYEVGFHVHPKWEGELDWPLTEIGMIPLTNDQAMVCSIFVADNTSGMYEAAALGHHVIALNAPTYRRDIHHGLRFWDAVPGLQINEPEEFLAVDLDAVVASPGSAALRDRGAAAAYAYMDGKSAQRAADAILTWLG